MTAEIVEQSAENKHPAVASCGELIRSLRRQRGFTLKQLSEKTGISTAQLGKIETGDANTSLKSLALIADALGVALAELFPDYRRIAPDDIERMVEKMPPPMLFALYRFLYECVKRR